MDAEQSKLLKSVRMHSFAALEAHLYLDSHPTCKQALEYFQKHKKAYEEALAKYEEKYAPLTVSGVNNTDEWTWATSPWPWERSEN